MAKEQEGRGAVLLKPGVRIARTNRAGVMSTDGSNDMYEENMPSKRMLKRNC